QALDLAAGALPAELGGGGDGQPETADRAAGARGTGSLLVACGLADGDGQAEDLAVAQHLDRRLGPGLGHADQPRQVAHLLDLLAVEADDQVTGLDAGTVGRTAGTDLGHQGPGRRIEVERLGELGGHLLDLHADEAALDDTVGHQRLDHGLGDGRRHGKADADAAPAGADDGGADADHLAGGVEYGAAGVARVDLGVELQVVVVRARIQVAPRG